MIIDTELNDATPVYIRRVRREDEARLLTAVLLLDCAREGLARSLGAEGEGHEGGVSVLEIDIAEALAVLRAETGVPGLAAVFARFDAQGLGAAPTCG